MYIYTEHTLGTPITPTEMRQTCFFCHAAVKHTPAAAFWREAFSHPVVNQIHTPRSIHAIGLLASFWRQCGTHWAAPSSLPTSLGPPHNAVHTLPQRGEPRTWLEKAAGDPPSLLPSPSLCLPHSHSLSRSLSLFLSLSIYLTPLPPSHPSLNFILFLFSPLPLSTPHSPSLPLSLPFSEILLSSLSLSLTLPLSDSLTLSVHLSLTPPSPSCPFSRRWWCTEYVFPLSLPLCLSPPLFPSLLLSERPPWASERDSWGQHYGQSPY